MSKRTSWRPINWRSVGLRESSKAADGSSFVIDRYRIAGLNTWPDFRTFVVKDKEEELMIRDCCRAAENNQILRSERAENEKTEQMDRFCSKQKEGSG